MKTDWTAIEKTIQASPRTLLWGPPGMGKTTILWKLREQLPEDERPTIYNVQLHDESTVAELIGHFVPVGDRFVWLDGPVMLAWKFGHWLLLDELDLASGGVLSVCRGILNDASVAKLVLPNPAMAGMSDEELSEALVNGRGLAHVSPAPGFKCVATMNGRPEDLDDALADRLIVRWEVNEPHPDAIRSLPEEMRDYAKAMAMEDDPNRRVGIRAWKSFTDLAPQVGDKTAAAAVFGSRSGDILAGITAARARFGKPTATETAVKASESPSKATDDVSVPVDTSGLSYPLYGAKVTTGPTGPIVFFRERTGKRGRPPKPLCSCGNDRQSRMFTVAPGAVLACAECSGRILDIGNFTVGLMDKTTRKATMVPGF